MRLLLLAAMVLSLGGAARAAETGQPFFEALYDVPVMPGLEEAADQAVLFDKPDGRIASVVAASAALSTTDITAYYEACLPQLGWRKISSKQYIRGNQRLAMEIVKKPPLTIVRFNLSPAGPPAGKH